VMILDMRYMTSGQMSALSEADLERARKETKEQIASDMAEYGKQRMQRAIEPLGTVDIRTSDIDALCDLFGGWTGGAGFLLEDVAYVLLGMKNDLPRDTLARVIQFLQNEAQ